MPFSTKIAALISCAILFVLIFELVRKKKIREEYSLIWLASSVSFFFLVLFDSFTIRLIHFLGGTNISSLFFFGGLFFSVIMLLSLTVQISDMKQKQNVLIQESGLQRERLECIEKQISK